MADPALRNCTAGHGELLQSFNTVSDDEYSYTLAACVSKTRDLKELGDTFTDLLC